MFLFVNFRFFATAVLELSRALGVPVGAVEKRLRRAEVGELSEPLRRESARVNRRKVATYV